MSWFLKVLHRTCLLVKSISGLLQYCLPCKEPMKEKDHCDHCTVYSVLTQAASYVGNLRKTWKSKISSFQCTKPGAHERKDNNTWYEQFYSAQFNIAPFDSAPFCIAQFYIASLYIAQFYSAEFYTTLFYTEHHILLTKQCFTPLNKQ